MKAKYKKNRIFVVRGDSDQVVVFDQLWWIVGGHQHNDEMNGKRPRNIVASALTIFGLAAAAALAAMAGENTLTHGLWVWKTPSVLQTPRAAESLRDFCRSAGINEVYVSVSAHDEKRRRAG
jgi:hypothetical protein